MLRRLGLSFVAAFALSATARATILPDNDLYLQDDLEAKTGVTQAEFDAIIQRARDIFAPIVAAHGGALMIKDKWNDSAVAASAVQVFGVWVVNIYGGLARRPELTPDGLTLALCHELGHHLSGFPFITAWGANEGQADYFATNHCSKLFWQDDAAGNARARAEVPSAPKAQCDAVYGTEGAQDLCYRQVVAGKSLADVFAAARAQTVSFDTPDTSVVDATERAHPAAQCRLDTYTSGALCDKEYDASVIPGKRGGTGRDDREAEEESATVNCADASVERGDRRPLCWFHPGL